MPDFIGQYQERNTHFPTQLLSRNKAKQAASAQKGKKVIALAMHVFQPQCS
jgi:hypothetical protein